MTYPTSESTPVAALDLGSNSFHMIIGRVIGGQLSVLDRLRDPVRLASGLDGDGRLSEEMLESMSDSLRRFGQRLEGVPPGRVRAIGTNTLRKTRHPKDVLARAGAALGYPIEILSGAEEARLIYLGVCQDQAPIEGRRLVADIGGGSTEVILGSDFQPIFTDSLEMGCVVFSMRFFRHGKLSRKAFKKAEIAAKLELETMERRFRRVGWKDCVGSSGTITAVAHVLIENGWTDGVIDLAGIKKLRRAMIEAGTVADLKLPGLQSDRKPVLAGGVAILKAVFESLRIESMRTSKAALREGLLYDLLGRIRQEDVRDRTIRALSERYHIDEEQAERVERAALAFLEQVADDWKLDRVEGARLLSWAARMHEIGLALAYAGHHKHGAYILANSNLPGFSRQDQERLAALVRGHRRKLAGDTFAGFPEPWDAEGRRLCILLRLAVRMSRTRSTELLGALQLSAESDSLEVCVPEEWTESRPLTMADLEDESLVLASAGFELKVTARAEESAGSVKDV